MPDFNTDLAADFVRLTKLQEEASERLDAIQRERAAVHDRLLAEFEKTGMSNLRIDGRTVYLRREVKAFKAKGVSTPALLDALRAAGLGDYVKQSYSAQSLSSLYRELDKSGEPPPPELEGVIVKAETYDVRAVKSS